MTLDVIDGDHHRLCASACMRTTDRSLARAIGVTYGSIQPVVQIIFPEADKTNFICQYLAQFVVLVIARCACGQLWSIANAWQAQATNQATCFALSVAR